MNLITLRLLLEHLLARTSGVAMSHLEFGVERVAQPISQ